MLGIKASCPQSLPDSKIHPFWKRTQITERLLVSNALLFTAFLGFIGDLSVERLMRLRSDYHKGGCFLLPIYISIYNKALFTLASGYRA